MSPSRVYNVRHAFTTCVGRSARAAGSTLIRQSATGPTATRPISSLSPTRGGGPDRVPRRRGSSTSTQRQVRKALRPTKLETVFFTRKQPPQVRSVQD